MERLKKLLYRIPEAGEVGGCGRSTAYEIAASGEWETIDTPYGRRVVAESLERWIEEKRQAGK
jgi:hypothetical protein